MRCALDLDVLLLDQHKSVVIKQAVNADLGILAV